MSVGVLHGMYECERGVYACVYVSDVRVCVHVCVYVLQRSAFRIASRLALTQPRHWAYQWRDREIIRSAVILSLIKVAMLIAVVRSKIRPSTEREAVWLT